MKICDVSVIIPNYNRTSLLRRALESVAAQTVLPREIIVIDDCSSEEALGQCRAIVADLNHRVPTRLLVNEVNRGANFSRNRGIFSAIGRYIAFLDSDDIWMPEKLSLQTAAIEIAKTKDSRPVLSGTGRYRVNGDGDIIACQFGGRVFNGPKIRRSNFIGTLSSTMVETWVARHIWGFNEALSACQDWDFFIRLGAYVQYVGVTESLCIYVDHDAERITLNNRKRLRSHIFIYRTHLKPYLGRLNIPAEFYRNIAEDYQEIGNAEKARKFLAKATSISKYKNKQLRRASEYFYNFLYCLSPPQSIKTKRYARYRTLMDNILKDPGLKDEIAQHQTFIRDLIHEGQRFQNAPKGSFHS